MLKKIKKQETLTFAAPTTTNVTFTPNSIPFRQFKNPIWDTVSFSENGPEQHILFSNPIGQFNENGKIKTEIDTNLTRAGMLAVPTKFDLVGFYARFLGISYKSDRKIIKANTLFQWYFSSRIWYEYPLDDILNNPVILSKIPFRIRSGEVFQGRLKINNTYKTLSKLLGIVTIRVYMLGDIWNAF